MAGGNFLAARMHAKNSIKGSPGTKRLVPSSSMTLSIRLKTLMAFWISSVGGTGSTYSSVSSRVSSSIFLALTSVTRLRAAVGESCKKSPRWMTMGHRPKLWCF